jgi:uncharacterized protein (TIGR02594 family)
MSAQHIYDVAEGFLGVAEYPAARHNPQILQFFGDAGHSWVQDDETPWCAAFVGSVLAQCGIQGTSKLTARSYLDWGEPVDLDKAQKGDVVVFWRGSRNGWQGHVAFYSHQDAEHIYVLGGNQGNKVSIAPYKKERLLGIRRVRQPRQNPVQSRTIQATAAQTAGVATAGVTAIASLEGSAQLVVIGAVAVIAVAAMVIFRERLSKWNAGDR